MQTNPNNFGIVLYEKPCGLCGCKLPVNDFDVDLQTFICADCTPHIVAANFALMKANVLWVKQVEPITQPFTIKRS